MTWLGQKPDTEPVRPIPPATAISPQVASHPVAGDSGERMASPKVAGIGRSVHVKGELTGNADLAIEGKVEGTIALNGYNVTIAPTGHVAAEIRAKSVVVGGQVTGSISAEERVEVTATGSLVGDVRAPRVVLADGARFKGRIDMDTKSGPGALVAAPAASRVMGNTSTAHDEAHAYASATKG